MNSHQSEVAAAATLRQCRAALAAGGSTVIAEVTGCRGPAAAAIVDWRHYPDGEVYDPATHAQYFFHRHAEPARPRAGGPVEYGHFHLFLRGDGIPAGVAPLILPELAVANARAGGRRPSQSAPLKRGARDELCHLVAIAVDAAGEPVRLLATNRWVTGETWYRADDVIAMLDRFRLADDGQVSRWLAALVLLFRPEIAGLLHQRDKTVTERRWRWRTDVLDDERLEIAASVEIDLDARLQAIEAGPAKPARPVAARPLLPRMAEGWGA